MQKKTKTAKSLMAVRERERERERESYTLVNKSVMIFNTLNNTLCLLIKNEKQNKIIYKYKKITI